MNKACNRCGIEKIFDQYFKDKAMPGGLAGVCKQCKMASTAEWREKNRAKYNADMRAYSKKHRYRMHIKKHYGLSLEDLEAMLKAQGNVCAICDQPQEGKRPLAIDHCHDSGRVRGLLCYSCNRSIVILDNPERLARAMKYLKR